MIILGVDPGIATTGVGVIEKNGSKLRLIGYKGLLTSPKDTLPERLCHLTAQFSAIISHYPLDCVAVEELFFNTNTTTAMIVAQARGALLLTAAQARLPIFSYTPLQIKMSVCGYGRAEKKQVQYMVKKLLNLSKVPKPDDAADAVAVAICHSHSHRLKSLA